MLASVQARPDVEASLWQTQVLFQDSVYLCLGWGLGFYTKVLSKNFTLKLKLSVSNLAFNYFAGTILIIKSKKVLKVELGAAIFI